MHAPALVRAGGETAGEQVPFAVAQTGGVADFPRDPAGFFLHVANLLESAAPRRGGFPVGFHNMRNFFKGGSSSPTIRARWYTNQPLCGKVGPLRML